MPIYTYTCKACVRDWEAFHSIVTRGDELCTSCGSPAIQTIENVARPIILGYYSDALGEHITGPKHLKRTMEAKDVERTD